MNKQKGFTLIELLVVIAIIGILSSIVLVSLNTARSKGNDAKVKGQLSSIRAAAEIYNTTNGSYGPTVTTCTTGMFVDPASASGLAALVATTNYPSGTTLDCGSTGTAWSVAASLSSSQYWCVDSTGVSRGATSAGTAYNALTGSSPAAHSAVGAPSCQ